MAKAPTRRFHGRHHAGVEHCASSDGQNAEAQTPSEDTGRQFGTYPERRAGLPHLDRMGSDRFGARGPTVIIIIISINIIIIIIIFLDS